MIYYFSGTGNSRFAAQKLALLTEDKSVNIASIYNGTVKSVEGKSDVTGFVFPVYYSGLPEMVKRFASNPQIREHLGEYVFCVITCGDEGSIYYSGDEKFRAEIFRTEFVGGTGSGDAFDAGLISALLDGCDAYESVKRATAQGMSCVRHGSATQSVFTKSELEEFLTGRELKTTAIS